jgi:hypothetical protein
LLFTDFNLQAAEVYNIPMRSGTLVLEKDRIDPGASRYIIVQFEKRIKRETSNQLRDMGVNPLSFRYRNAWICAVEPSVLTDEVINQFGSRAVAPWKAEYKATAELRRGNVSDLARTPEGEIKLLVTFFQDVSQTEVAGTLAHYDAPYSLFREPNVYAIKVASGQIESLLNEPPVYTLKEGPRPL